MKLLLKHYNKIVQSEEDVEELKKVILQYAIRGKIVKQETNQKSAESLFKEIEDEKEYLIQKKLIRRQNLPMISEGEIPFKIPETWKWVRLGEIGDWGAGATPNRKTLEFYRNGTVPWLKTGELNDGFINSSAEKITELAVEKTSVRLNKPGDVLIAMYGATIGRLGILEIEATTNQACCACTPFKGVYNRYLFYYLLAKREQFRSLGSGGAQPNISRTKIINYLFPLAPFEEQKRIVNKIDYLFGFCDLLTEHIRLKNSSSTILNTSAFNRIQDASNPNQKENLNFAIRNMDNICNTKNDVQLLRESLLSLAVQGKLVKQDSNDEPASLLIKKIEKKKEQLIKEKKIRRQRKLPEITEEEKPYELPEGWEWVRLGNLVSKLGAGKTPLGGSKNYTKSGIKFIRSQNVWNEGLRLDGIVYIPEEVNDSMKGSIVLQEDLLLNITGASIGRSCLLPHNFITANVNQHVAIIRLIKPEFRFYIHKCITSPYIQKEIMNVQVGVSREGLSMAKLAQFLIPIPPLEEQKRIVAKLKSLFKIISKIEDDLEKKEKYAEHLRESILNNENSSLIF